MTKLTKPFVPVNLVGPQVSLPLCWVPAGRGNIHFFVRNKEALPCVRRWLVGPTCQRGARYFREIQRPFRWVPDVRWRNHCFACNKEAFPCVRPWTQLSASPRIVRFQWMSFIDHVDQAAPRAPGRWTTARPRKGTTRSQVILGSCFPRGGVRGFTGSSAVAGE